MPDLATANDNGKVTVFLGDGMGRFGAPASFPAGTNPASIAVGDFNGDGKPDFAVANYGDKNISVLLNQSQ